jgi:acyl dehydratase
VRRVGDQQWSVDDARSLQFPPMRTITGLEELKQAAGEELGVSDWHQVTQKDIDAFADATGDHQWIHVDPERAKDTPFGGTIAHGYYTLSLAPMLTDEVLKMDGFAFAVIYGLITVRFPSLMILYI